MFFVLSSGRSGSKTIAHTLDGFTNCDCFHEPEPSLVVEGPQYYYGELAGQAVADILQQRIPPKDHRIYGESNLFLSLVMPVLNETFPECKFIWLLRDGRETVSSMFDRGWFDLSAKRVMPIYHASRLAGDKTGDYTESEWRNLSRFAKCCWIWLKYNLIIEEALRDIPTQRRMVVRLDTLKSSLPQIQRFLGLRGRRRVRVQKHNTAFQPVRHWEEWTIEQRDTFERMCGEKMDGWFSEWRDGAGTWMPIQGEEPDAWPSDSLVRRLLRSSKKRAKRLVNFCKAARHETN
ncbi:MAG: hypothetical protein MK165_21765 [Pirellulaceae bacterium]|nr:hypothetical protein [Pirellulaceae bacterium]